jgi:hypothetical protein
MKVNQGLYMKNGKVGEFGENSSGPLIQFYRGQIGDNCGRKLDEILLWDNDRLEYTHDYIQWLFPLRSPSPINPAAPTLDNDQIIEFQMDSELKFKLEEAFKRMMNFYGFSHNNDSGQITIEMARNWNERKRVWLKPGNHNYRRITRILESLKYFGLSAHAMAFYKILMKVYESPDGRGIDDKSVRFWMSAVGRL